MTHRQLLGGLLFLALTLSPNTSRAETKSSTSAEGSFVHYDIGGYYRLRTQWIQGLPTLNPDVFAVDRKDLASKADFAFMRLRLNPSISFGRDKNKPIAKLNFQLDGFDNVVLGDNDLLADTPVFGDQPSNTDILGVDIDSINLRRAWVEFMIPVGQLRVGRMGTQWGLGLLANDGNGLEGDFGDARFGTTNDRILFATRPLTIFNAIVNNDRSETPLIFVAAYDKIVEDPFLDRSDFRFDDSMDARNELPFRRFVRHFDDVQQVVFALIWNDKDLSFGEAGDQLTVGIQGTERWQESSESSVLIYDMYWRFKYSAFGKSGPRLISEAEILTIQGQSRAISVGTLTEPNVYNGVVRVGAEATAWDAVLELGSASGDAVIADGDFTSRAFNPDYRLGLIMFPIVMQARTAHQFQDNPALWSKGGVYNANYLFPLARFRPTKNVEFVGALLLAWADQLTPVIGGSQRDDGSVECGLFESDCALGWELDTAMKVKWGENDLMRWSTEFGLMSPGKALETVIQEDLIWTLQSRIGLVW